MSDSDSVKYDNGQAFRKKSQITLWQTDTRFLSKVSLFYFYY